MVYLLNEQQILLKESADSFVRNEHILKEQRELILNPEQNSAKHWNNFSPLRHREKPTETVTAPATHE